VAKKEKKTIARATVLEAFPSQQHFYQKIIVDFDRLHSNEFGVLAVGRNAVYYVLEVEGRTRR